MKKIFTLTGLLFFSQLMIQTSIGFSQRGMLPEQLDSLIQNKAEILIIDVRPDYEYKEADQVTDAVHIPYEMLALELKKLGLEYSKQVIVYDRSGNIGRLAANFMRKMGYINVYYIFGGLYAWNDYVAKKTSVKTEILAEQPFGSTNEVMKDSLLKDIPVDSAIMNSVLPGDTTEIDTTLSTE